VGAWTATKAAEDVMMTLQNAGVPAGVCQNSEDRCDNDPQLRHLKWLTEVTGTKIGTWPIYELPMKFSRTPAYIGGPIDRGAPGYGEDNEWLADDHARHVEIGCREVGGRRRDLIPVTK
jgi:crotonobetainyl-CoA:carnitine CoA-transferase CaiB-like acyl-CoA transferase